MKRTGREVMSSVLDTDFQEENRVDCGFLFSKGGERVIGVDEKFDSTTLHSFFHTGCNIQVHSIP